MACDICGAHKPLVALRDIYQTKSIKEICSDCEGKVNKKLDSFREWNCVLLKAWMGNIKLWLKGATKEPSRLSDES